MYLIHPSRCSFAVAFANSRSNFSRAAFVICAPAEMVKRSTAIVTFILLFPFRLRLLNDLQQWMHSGLKIVVDKSPYHSFTVFCRAMSDNASTLGVSLLGWGAGRGCGTRSKAHSRAGPAFVHGTPPDSALAARAPSRRTPFTKPKILIRH